MSKSIERMRRISRRESLQGAALLPVGALIAGRFMVSCAGASRQTAAPEQAGSRAQPTTGSATAGRTATDATAGAPATTAGGAGASGAAAGAPARAGAPAAGSGAGAGASGAAGAPSAGGTSASSGSGGTTAPAGGAGAPAAGSGGMISVADVPWASGGTKSTKGPYPDPFAMGMGGTACKLYPAQTLGPCYTQGPEMREDISDGAKGLPLRLSLLVVRSNGCTPVAGATVDVWHSGFDGVYSAYGSGVCNPDRLDVADQMFCRGVQTTNEQGRVDFSTIFPGWYSSRTVHIHFTVRVGGSEQVTSQLYFEDPLTTEIQAQGEYKARGMRGTTNATDAIFRSGGASAADVILSTAKRADGALHAWKVLAIG